MNDESSKSRAVYAVAADGVSDSGHQLYTIHQKRVPNADNWKLFASQPAEQPRGEGYDVARHNDWLERNAQPKPEQAVGDGVSIGSEEACKRLSALIDEYEHGETGGTFGRKVDLVRDFLNSDAVWDVFRDVYAPRPAVATAAEVTDGLSNVIEWHERERDTQRKLGHDSQADMHDCYASVIRTLTAQCQVRKDGQGVGGAWHTKPITDPDNPWRRAVEHAGYLVTAIDHYLHASASVAVELDQIEGIEDPSDEQLEILHAVQEDEDEARARVRDLSYEFTKRRDHAVASLASPSAGAGVPDGWKLVPADPTSEMRSAFQADKPPRSFARTTVFIGDFGDRYAAMLAAAPEVPRG